MTYKKLLVLSLCLFLTGCAPKPPAAQPEEAVPDAPAITTAPIEGENVSPDGKWEVIQTGVNEGITAGGLYPSESVCIVNRESGEVLWQDGGAYQIHAAWPEGSEFVVIARTSRTRVEVTAVSTLTGESCPVLLPGEEPIPEYTFLAEDWIAWTDEDSFELALDGGDGVGISTYWCSPVEDPPQSPLKVSVVQACYETIPGAYDFTHDGQSETVELVTAIAKGDRTDGKAYPAWFELHILNADGQMIWAQRGIALQHIGWTNLFACTLDGKDYILEYNPYTNMGLASFSYRLFSLTEAGEELLLKKNDVWFDLNFGSPIFTGEYDPAAIGAFMEDVHTYLDQSTLLVSTQDGELLTNIPGSDYRRDIGVYQYEGTWEERFVRYWEELEQKPG